MVQSRLNVAIVGGILEWLSLITGYRALLILVAVLYACAFLTGRRRVVVGGRGVVLLLLSYKLSSFRQFGLFAIFTGDNIAGKTSRLAAPFALVLPFFMEILRACAIKSPWFKHQYATTLAASFIATTAKCCRALRASAFTARRACTANVWR